MRIRAAGLGDLEQLIALERGIEAAPHWSEVVWRDALTVDPAGAGLARVVYVGEDERGLTGFVVGSCVGDVAELESIGVVETVQRGGVGLRLLRALIAWARDDRQANVLELEVRESNAVAGAFYRAAGFEEQGRRRGYYASPREDAVLLVLPLLQSGDAK